MRVVLCHVVGDARLSAVYVGPTQFLGVDDFSRGGLHQRWSAEKDGALVAHNDGFVRHGRYIGATRGARAQHRRDLRDAPGGHARLVIEGAAEVLAIRKHLVLQRQVGATRVDQIQTG